MSKNIKSIIFSSLKKFKEKEIIKIVKKSSGHWEIELEYKNNYGNKSILDIVVADEVNYNNLLEKQIESSVWSFSADVIAEITGLSNVKAIKNMQESCCEDCNEILLKIIDLDELVEKVKELGEVGNILNGYDGKLLKLKDHYIWYN